MGARRRDGTALLVAGHGALGALDASALHTLGQIGEALLATGDAWQIRRLAAGDPRHPVDRGTLKQHIDELAGERVRAAVLVILGTIARIDGELALVTSAQARDYPEDATLPLSWIRERIHAAHAEQLVVLVSARGDGTPAQWLAALRTQRPAHLVVGALCDGERHPVVDALLTALCGDALDPRTGTVTMASLSQYLGRHDLAVAQASDASETLAQPPPLGGLWDVRRSQLSQRATRPRTSGDHDDLTGVVLPGRFRVDKLVARGTFGAVYRARQLAVERDVAVKVLHADIDPSSEDGRLFVHEVRSVGRIDHANVVRIFQADMTHDGRLFFAMELLDGRDLQQLAANGPMPRARAIELVRQLLGALGAAHDAGLVHADIKPANAIVVEREGSERVVLVDFGLSRLRATDRPAESAGGTPAYMAPEQMHLGRVDAKSDLFSAALVLVYLLTGWRRPNAATSLPPFDLIADADLRAVLQRALELDPAKRFASARELAAALTGATPTVESDVIPAAPFRHLAPLTEADRGRLYGREAELAAITEHALYRRSVIYTAPSGTGKTSLLRAGLVPRLEALGVHPVYVRCRTDCAAAVAQAILASVEAHAARRSDLPSTEPKHTATVHDATTARLARDATERQLHAATPGGGATTGGRSTSGASTGGRAMPTSASNGAANTTTPTSPSNGSSSAPPPSASNGATSTGTTSASNGAVPGGSNGHVAHVGSPIAHAIATWQRVRGGKLVLVLDQLEAALGEPELAAEVLGFDRWGDADVAVVLSVREDQLARLVAQAQAVEPGIPIVRLPPLGLEGARAAITNPLTAARLAIEPELLDLLLADLQRAAATIGPEMGWGTAPAVFPPHLQLACSVLYEALPPGEATLTLAHYKRLGGFDAIVGEHLERVLDTELTDGADRIARALFIALVTATHERAMRPETELIAIVGDADRSAAVLELLRSRGLLVRVRGDDGELQWELAHDSLVPRVLRWIDSRDLAKRRAIELLRYHLRRSTPGAPSLLGRTELRELNRHPDAVAELDAEFERRGAEGWTPSRLVELSRRLLRRQTGIITALFVAALGVAGVALYDSHVEAVRIREQDSLRARDLGRFVLELEPYDWDPAAKHAIDAPPLRDPLHWTLHTWSNDEPGDPFPDDFVVHGTPHVAGGALVEAVEAHGGRAFLVVSRGACRPSVIPLQDVPGFAKRDREEPTFRIRVPTCAATLAGTVPIPAGPFVYGGLGDPPSQFLAEYPDPKFRTDRRVVLPAFRIDRTEVTNAAFAELAAMSTLTGITRPHYPATTAFGHASDPAKPVTGVNWAVAHAYCRYLGKDLPTSEQWVKAMRGGEALPDGSPNPAPKRNLPWGGADPSPAQLDLEHQGTADVGSHPGDVSVYGVLDLAGNAEEWTSTAAESEGFRVVRGGETADSLIDFMALANPREESQPLFSIGLRCVVTE